MVIAESELVGVSLQMLRGNMVKSPVKRPLHLRPKALYGIGMDFALGELLASMINRPVGITHIPDVSVAQKLIGHDFGTFGNIGFNHRLNRGAFNIGNYLDANFPFAFNFAKNGGFPYGSASALSRPLAAKIAFIHFYNAGKQVIAAFHKEPNLIRNAPSAFISNSKLSFKLFSRNSILRLAHQKNSVKPGNKTCGALVKDGAFRRVDLMAARASVGAASLDRVKVFLPAFGAFKTFWVSVFEDMRQTSLIIGEVFFEFFYRVFHTNSIAENLLVVKG